MSSLLPDYLKDPAYPYGCRKARKKERREFYVTLATTVLKSPRALAVFAALSALGAYGAVLLYRFYSGYYVR